MKFNTVARKAGWRAQRRRNAALAREIGMCQWCWRYPAEVEPDGTRRLGCTVCYVQRAIAQAHRRAEGRA